MMWYKIMYTDLQHGFITEIDRVCGPVGYTAEDYIRDCKEQSTQEWNDMLSNGKISVYLCGPEMR